MNSYSVLADVYPNTNKMSPARERGYKSNNQFDNFPSMMNDGRSVPSSWVSNSVVNDGIKKRNNIKSNWEYRQYMTKNANDIMKYNFTETATDVGFSNSKPEELPSIQSNKFSSLAPAKAIQSLIEVAEDTLEKQSDLKVNYLTREELQARRVSPAITQEELMRKKVPITKVMRE